MNILIVIGTRPEAIKLAPLIHRMKKSEFMVQVCSTSQHKEILTQVLSFFNIIPEYDLHLMRSGQTLLQITSRAAAGLENILNESSPDYVVVQGDTTTAFVAALAAYYNKIPIIHIEAGLRSGNLSAPFPEEGNRALIGQLANLHFTPTEEAAKNLQREGIKNGVYVVGNTVIDALLLGLELIKNRGDAQFLSRFKEVDFSKKIILVTAHRRENMGRPLEHICSALKKIATHQTDVEIVFSVHPNPLVTEPVHASLGNIPSIHLVDPLDYSDFLWIMNKAHLILTDSGGIQEEAPSLGKPVFVMREVTERTEGIKTGVAKLVGTSSEKIFSETMKIMKNEDAYTVMATRNNPYGNGDACKKIVDILATVSTRH